jgi:ABC-type multidrug transport system permease subunit
MYCERIYPITMMPDWLKMVAQFKPLTDLVDAIRSLMIQGAQKLETIRFSQCERV